MECKHLQPGSDEGDEDDGFISMAKAYTIRALPWAATAAVGILLNLATALHSSLQLGGVLKSSKCAKYEDGKDKRV